MRSPLGFVLSLPVHFYQRVISPLKPKTCRFHPTCSSYALDALREHGAFKGSWLTVKRLCRCQPFCEPGYDPVPPKRGELRAADAAVADTAQPGGEPIRRPSSETDPRLPQ